MKCNLSLTLSKHEDKIDSKDQQSSLSIEHNDELHEANSRKRPKKINILETQPINSFKKVEIQKSNKPRNSIDDDETINFYNIPKVPKILSIQKNDDKFLKEDGTPKHHRTSLMMLTRKI